MSTGMAIAWGILAFDVILIVARMAWVITRR